jgi:hypothetical protein
MEKRKFPKKPRKPRIPYKPVKAVLAKNILFETVGQMKNKVVSLDVKIIDLLYSLPSTVEDEDLHILVELEDDPRLGPLNFRFTLYALESVKNPNYYEERDKYEEKKTVYEKEMVGFNKERLARKAAIKDIIKNEEKPRRKEVAEDEDSGLVVHVKNRSVR